MLQPSVLLSPSFGSVIEQSLGKTNWTNKNIAAVWGNKDWIKFFTNSYEKGSSGKKYNGNVRAEHS